MSQLPINWSVVLLGTVANKLVDGSHNPPAKSDEGHPMLSARNINERQIVFDDFRLIEPSAFEVENRRTDIAPGDVLLTIVGAIGRSAVVPVGLPKFTLQRSVAVIEPSKAIDPSFLSYVFEGPTLQAWLYDNAKGTAQKGIYLKKLATAEIPLPPLPEQHRIVAKIDSLFARSKRARQHLEHVVQATSARKLIDKLEQAILAKAFRGELVPQDPNDEPASVLLERIRTAQSAQSAGSGRAGRSKKVAAR